MRWSDAQLKQAIERSEGALSSLRELDTAADVEDRGPPRLARTRTSSRRSSAPREPSRPLRELDTAADAEDAEGHAFRHG